MSSLPPPSPSSPDKRSVEVHLREAGPRIQEIQYNGKTYLVEVFRKDPTGQFTENVTSSRDWTDMAIATLNTTNEVFKENSKADDFSNAKTIHVTLSGQIATAPQTDPSSSSSTPSASSSIKIEKVQYEKSVTLNPREEISVTDAVSKKIQGQLTSLGKEAATWKDPTKLQSSTPTSQTPNQTPSTQNPQSTNPPQPSPSQSPSSEPIHLPSITKPPIPSNASESLLDSFLKSNGVDSNQSRKTAPECIAAQVNAIRGTKDMTAESLQKATAEFIGNNRSDYKSFEDLSEMLQVLRTPFENNSNQIPQQMKEGCKKLNEADLGKLQEILERDKDNLSEDEKEIVIKAFSNYLYQLAPASNELNYPKVFFKAAHSFINQPKRALSKFLPGYVEPPQVNLLIVTKNDQDQYKTWGRWPNQGQIKSQETVFICYDEKPSQAPSTGKYSGFARTYVSTRDPQEKPRPLAQGNQPQESYYPSTFSIETGGGGNCAASSVTDALYQLHGTKFANEAAWKAGLESDKTTNRQTAMSYIFDHPEAVLDPSYDLDFFDQINSNVTDSYPDILQSMPSYSATLNELNERRINGKLTEPEKKWLVQLYAAYAIQKNKDLDHVFFLAYAKASGTKIAVIGNGRIIFTAPPATERIDKASYAFVEYTPPASGNSGHYKSVNRSHANLDRAISGYDSEHAHLFARRAFLQSIDSPQNIPAKLAEMQKDDPEGYLTLLSLVGKETLENASKIDATPKTIEAFVKALYSSTNTQENQPLQLKNAITLEMNRQSPQLKARIEFFKKFFKLINKENISPFNSEEVIAEAIKSLRQKDPSGYLALKEQLKDIDLHKITSSTIDRLKNHFNISASDENEVNKKAFEFANGITNTLYTQPELVARGNFLHIWRKTISTPSKENKEELKSAIEHLKANDPAYWIYVTYHCRNVNTDAILNAITTNVSDDQALDFIKQIEQHPHFVSSCHNLANLGAELKKPSPDAGKISQLVTTIEYKMLRDAIYASISLDPQPGQSVTNQERINNGSSNFSQNPPNLKNQFKPDLIANWYQHLIDTRHSPL